MYFDVILTRVFGNRRPQETCKVVLDEIVASVKVFETEGVSAHIEFFDADPAVATVSSLGTKVTCRHFVKIRVTHHWEGDGEETERSKAAVLARILKVAGTATRMWVLAPSFGTGVVQDSDPITKGFGTIADEADADVEAADVPLKVGPDPSPKPPEPLSVPALPPLRRPLHAGTTFNPPQTPSPSVLLKGLEDQWALLGDIIYAFARGARARVNNPLAGFYIPHTACHGPPGCGKTTMNVEMLGGMEVVSGKGTVYTRIDMATATEAGIADIFASQNQTGGPTPIFLLDEIDKNLKITRYLFKILAEARASKTNHHVAYNFPVESLFIATCNDLKLLEHHETGAMFNRFTFQIPFMPPSRQVNLEMLLEICFHNDLNPGIAKAVIDFFYDIFPDPVTGLPQDSPRVLGSMVKMGELWLTGVMQARLFRLRAAKVRS